MDPGKRALVYPDRCEVPYGVVIFNEVSLQWINDESEAHLGDRKSTGEEGAGDWGLNFPYVYCVYIKIW